MAKSTHSQEILTGTSDSYTETEATERPFPLYSRPELGSVDHPVTTEEEETEALDRVTEEIDSDEETDSTETEESEWDGGSSIPSSTSGSKSEQPNRHSNRSPARTMDNRSNQTEQADSIADSTDGDGPKEEPKRSSKPRKAANPRQARTRTTDDEDDEFGFRV